MSERERPGRRGFFREVVNRYVVPATEFVEEKLDRQTRPLRLLRPPGAGPDFLELCSKCHACVEACPANAIFPDRSSDGLTASTPVIRADHQPCVVCDDLACMPACPTGALTLLTRDAIRMGVARVDWAQCERTHNVECTTCVELCPIGASALTIERDRIVVGDGCVGCGVCEHACPTRPRAIVVEPEG